MGAVSGTLAITDPSVNINKWRVMFLDPLYLNYEGYVDVVTNGSTPVPWSFNTYSPVYAAAIPQLDEFWGNKVTFSLGQVIVPYENANQSQHYFELTSINPVNNDPYWSDVVFRLNADESLIDDKGHALSVLPNSSYRIGYSPSTPYMNGSYLGGSAVQFSEYGYSSPITVDNVDMNLGTGDFTIQFWVTDYYGSTLGTVFCYGTPGSGTEIIMEAVRFQPVKIWLGSTLVYTSATNFTTNYENWVISRQSGTMYIIRNGTLMASVANALSISGPIHLGALPTEPKKTFTGRLFDFCVTKNRARYIDTFTPWQARSLGPQQALTGDIEPEWPTELNATIADGAYTWTAKHRIVKPVLHGPFWPV